MDQKTLLRQVLADANLFAAWEQVRANKGAAGVDGQTIDQFQQNAFGRLLTLKHQVERHEYRPAALLERRIPKDDGGQRRLLIPTVRDRILQTACSRVLAPRLERGFDDGSFAYRAGRSVPMAVARVAWYRDQGYQWVVDADIRQFFDQVDHDRLLAALRQALASDNSLLPLIEQWLRCPVQPDTDHLPYLLDRGLPQGAPISPLLANLYLDHLDEALVSEHLRFVRFADDFVILCKDRRQAEAALELTEDVLEALKLGVNERKTRITHFDEGFRFLGVDFIRNLMRPADPKAAPWVLPDGETRARAAPETETETEPPAPVLDPELPPETLDEILHSLRQPPPPDDDPADLELAEAHIEWEENPALEPCLRTLHVGLQGARLLKEGERILITHESEILAAIPGHKVDHVLLQGNQLVSTALLAHWARQGIRFHLIDHAGRLQALLLRRRGGDLRLERAQHRLQEDADFRLMAARACVEGKIHNSRVILRRFLRRRPDDEAQALLRTMENAERGLATADTIDRVRGLEGAAAHAYYRAIARLLPAHWAFPGRRRRPPPDPFNLLLSFGYAVLFHTLHTLVERRGLHPWLGNLHTSDGRHPALVSDLMEEFRAPVVDAVALHALLNNFEPGDFLEDPQGPYPCRLTDAARKRYLTWLHNKFRSQLVHPRTGRRLDYHRLIQYQAHHYARVVLGEEPVYRPYKAR